MKVRDILKNKDAHLETIAPDKTIRDVINKIVARKIGDLLVMDNDQPVGIITERDVIRILGEHGVDGLDGKVEDHMTKKLIIGFPDDEIDAVMAFMTINRFRHLPIMEKKKLIGIISIGDIVATRVHNLKVENRFLTDYIAGKYPG